MLVFKCFLVFENQAKALRAMTTRVRADGRAFKKAHRAKRVKRLRDHLLLEKVFSLVDFVGDITTSFKGTCPQFIISKQ